MRPSRGLLSLVLLVSCSPDATPPANVPAAPAMVAATLQADGAVQLTWARAPSAVRTLLARFQPGGTAQQPDGTPAVGDAIGADGVVLFLGAEEAFVDRSPPVTCGALSYRLWSQDAQGRWSESVGFVELGRGATTPAPTQAPSGLSATQVGRTLRVSWTNPPASSGFFQTTLVRKLGSAPASLSDGTQVLTTPGTLYSESLRPWSPDVQLFYAAFACNACGRCTAAPAVVSFTVPATSDGGIDGGLRPDAGAVDGGAELTPTNFTATLSPDGQLVQLGWVNADAGTLTSVRVTRVLTEARSDGGAMVGAPVQVFEGLSTSASERVDALLPSTSPARTYTYSAVGCSSVGCETAGPTATLTLTLKQALRGGGYTISWRHASADVCNDRTSLCPATPPPGQTCAQAVASTSAADWWKTCLADPPTCSTNARQLNPVSAPNETAAVNGWFTANGVTVGRVLTSEFCRCFTTAQQFSFGPTLEYSADLTFFVHEESLRCAKTMALLNQLPSQGTNTAMVTHAGFTCPTLDTLAWAEAAIYKPQPPSTRSCTTVGTCNADEACVAGFCVRPLFIARVPALGAGGWATLP
ncbi:MAG: hypothetical protein JNJ54_21585 [Myxococcaceae bacterium]|nr:hypothetical protein [Myxococcaceae bacterium]